MVIERIELRVLRLPLVRFFETSFGRVHDRTFMLVKLEGGGVTAWGECVADSDPFYGPETVETAWHIIADFLAPLVLGVRFAHPRDVFPALRRVRGHHMAKAAVEMAAWDLYARQEGLPLVRRARRHADARRGWRLDRHPGLAGAAGGPRGRRAGGRATGASRSR